MSNQLSLIISVVCVASPSVNGIIVSNVYMTLMRELNCEFCNNDFKIISKSEK